MGRLSLFLVLLLLPSSGCSKNSENKKDEWPPRTGKHDAEAASIPKDSDLNYSVAGGEPFTEFVGSFQFDFTGTRKIPKPGAATKGTLITKIGPVQKEARFATTDWVYFRAPGSPYIEGSPPEPNDWGPCITSGELLISKHAFMNAPAERHVHNVFYLEDFGPDYYLVKLEPEKHHQVCVLRAKDGSVVVTAGYIGTKVHADGGIIERKTDGWYRGNERITPP